MLIDLVGIGHTKHIAEILVRATYDVCIFEVFQDGRHQLDGFVSMGATEVHIVIDDGSGFTGLVQQFLDLVTQLGSDGIERPEHHDVFTGHFRHIHIQTQAWIILVEGILRIVLLVKESQRYRRFTVGIYLYIVRTDAIVLHEVQDDVAHMVATHLADEGHIGPCSAQ